MATLGQDTTAAAAAPTTHSAAYEVGGAGGKFRKRPFRRGQTTPYDRPPTSIRNPSWLSKLVVEPASKLINAGARRFFASLFQKALPPPPVLPAIAAPPPPATQQDSRDICQTSVPNSHAGDCDPDLVKHGDAACNSNGNAFSELEHLLKQKTFTRSEIDRLTELLHSKAAYSSIEDAGNRIDISKPASDFSRSLVGDYKADIGVCHGVTSTALINKKIVESDVATPAELAKTYMGSRQTKASPSMLNFRSQTVKEVVPYVSQSPMQLSKRPMVTDNGFTTPKSHGRSAVYNMARTPYSRVRPTNFHQAGSSSFYPNAGPSSSQSRLEHDDVFGSKQLSLKRRSSALEDDALGSFGPIRRTRQKSNLFYNNHDASLPIRGTESSSKNYPFVNRTLGKNQDSGAPSTSRFHVPNKSSETAAKILEVISKLSPKEKASESKSTTIKDNKLPSQLTTDMLHGQARKSLERLDSSRFLQTALISAEADNRANARAPDGGNPTLPKLSHVEESRPTKFADTASHVAGSGVTVSERNVQVNADTVYPSTVAPPVKEKRAFKMSALEDSFELDDDMESAGVASKPLSEGKGKQEIAPISNTLVSTKAQLQHKPASHTETSTSPGVWSKKTDKDIPNNVHAGVNGSDLSTSVCLADAKSKNAYATETEGSGLTLPGSKIGILSCLNKNVSTASDSFPQLPVGDNSQKIGINGHLEASPNASTSTTPTNNLFAAPSNNSSNGKVLAANNSESHAATSVSIVASSISAAATTNGSTTSSVFGLTGSSLFSSTTFSAPTAPITETPDVTAKATKTDNAINVENLKTSTSISGTSVDTHNIFGLRPSEKQHIATQPQGSLFSTGGDSVSAKFLPQSGNSSGPQTISPQFDLSKSSSGFGTSHGVSTSSSPFTSTAPTELPFGSDSLRPTSAENNRIGSGSSSATPSIFPFGNNTKSSIGTTSNGVTTFTPNFGETSVSKVSSPLETKVLTPSIGTTTSLSSSSAGVPTIPFASGSSTVSTFSTSTTPTLFSFSASSASPTNTGVFSGSSAASSSSTITSGLFTSTVASSGNTTPGTFMFSGNSSFSSSSSPAPFGFTSGSTPSFSTTTSPGLFAFTATSAASPGNTTTPAVFGFTGSSAGSSTTTAGVNTTTPALFNFTASSSASPSTGSTPFGTSSSAFSIPKTPPTLFGTNPASSGPVFQFGASAPTPQPIFGNSNPLPSPFTASQDQMTMEDTMAEDQVHAGSAPAPVSVFGQPPSNTPAAPPGAFVFGTTPSLSPNPFQFNQGAPPPQNPSPFQPTTSLEFNNGSGSFSLGSSGPDKSGRRIVKVNRAKNRKK